MGGRDEETSHTPTGVTRRGEDLYEGDFFSTEDIGRLQEFHDDTELILAEDRGRSIEGGICAEIHIGGCRHHVANPEIHGFIVSWVGGGFHGMKNDRECLVPGRKTRFLFANQGAAVK